MPRPGISQLLSAAYSKSSASGVADAGVIAGKETSVGSDHEVASSRPAVPHEPSPRSFSIPRRDLQDGSKLKHLTSDSREAKELLRVIRSSCRDQAITQNLSFYNMLLFNCPELDKAYQAKRQDMRNDGYGATEVVDSYCFVPTANQKAATQLAEAGFAVGQHASSHLGDKSMGIYVSRHFDVCALGLKVQQTSVQGWVVVAKLLKGRVKTVGEVTGADLLEPTPGFDCHISRNQCQGELISSSNYSQIYSNTQCYVYEFDDASESGMSSRPRQCCPYGLVLFSYEGPAIGGLNFYKLPIVETPDARLRAAAPPDRPGKTAMSTEPKGAVCWTGSLQNKSKFLAVVQLLSFCTTPPPSGLGKAMNIKNKVLFSKLLIVFPSPVFKNGLPASRRSEPEMHGDRMLYYYQMDAVDDASGHFRQLKSFLLEHGWAGVVDIDESKKLYLIPTSEVTVKLGLSRPSQSLCFHCVLVHQCRPQLTAAVARAPMSSVVDANIGLPQGTVTPSVPLPVALPPVVPAVMLSSGSVTNTGTGGDFPPSLEQVSPPALQATPVASTSGISSARHANTAPLSFGGDTKIPAVSAAVSQSWTPVMPSSNLVTASASHGSSMPSAPVASSVSTSAACQASLSPISDAAAITAPIQGPSASAVPATGKEDLAHANRGGVTRKRRDPRLSRDSAGNSGGKASSPSALRGWPKLSSNLSDIDVSQLTDINVLDKTIKQVQASCRQLERSIDKHSHVVDQHIKPVTAETDNASDVMSSESDYAERTLEQFLESSIQEVEVSSELPGTTSLQCVLCEHDYVSDVERVGPKSRARYFFQSNHFLTPVGPNKEVELDVKRLQAAVKPTALPPVSAVIPVQSGRLDTKVTSDKDATALQPLDEARSCFSRLVSSWDAVKNATSMDDVQRHFDESSSHHKSPGSAFIPVDEVGCETSAGKGQSSLDRVLASHVKHGKKVDKAKQLGSRSSSEGPSYLQRAEYHRKQTSHHSRSSSPREMSGASVTSNVSPRSQVRGSTGKGRSRRGATNKDYCRGGGHHHHDSSEERKDDRYHHSQGKRHHRSLSSKKVMSSSSRLRHSLAESRSGRHRHKKSSADLLESDREASVESFPLHRHRSRNPSRHLSSPSSRRSSRSWSHSPHRRSSRHASHHSPSSSHYRGSSITSNHSFSRSVSPLEGTAYRRHRSVSSSHQGSVSRSASRSLSPVEAPLRTANSNTAINIGDIFAPVTNPKPGARPTWSSIYLKDSNLDSSTERSEAPSSSVFLPAADVGISSGTVGTWLENSVDIPAYCASDHTADTATTSHSGSDALDWLSRAGAAWEQPRQALPMGSQEEADSELQPVTPIADVSCPTSPGTPEIGRSRSVSPTGAAPVSIPYSMTDFTFSSDPEDEDTSPAPVEQLLPPSPQPQAVAVRSWSFDSISDEEGRPIKETTGSLSPEDQVPLQQDPTRYDSHPQSTSVEREYRGGSSRRSHSPLAFLPAASPRRQSPRSRIAHGLVTVKRHRRSSKSPDIMNTSSSKRRRHSISPVRLKRPRRYSPEASRHYSSLSRRRSPPPSTRGLADARSVANAHKGQDGEDPRTQLNSLLPEVADMISSGLARRFKDYGKRGIVSESLAERLCLEPSDTVLGSMLDKRRSDRKKIVLAEDVTFQDVENAILTQLCLLDYQLLNMQGVVPF